MRKGFPMPHRQPNQVDLFSAEHELVTSIVLQGTPKHPEAVCPDVIVYAGKHYICMSMDAHFQKYPDNVMYVEATVLHY